MGNKLFLPIGFRNEDYASKLLIALWNHPAQERKALIWDSCLAKAATVRAVQISHDFSHCFEGNCANRIVRGICPLPSDYPENGNSIESLIGGVLDPIKALEFLLNSPKHADHLLGRIEFFRLQSRAGIGFWRRDQSKYQYYYAILISR